MTCIEKLKLEHPDKVEEDYQHGCPSAYGYLPDPDSAFDYCTQNKCAECWNREIPETEEKSALDHMKEMANARYPEPEVNKPRILDSGNRREFESGAVRDIQEGKGRCDLLPLDVVAEYVRTDVGTSKASILYHINCFQEENNTKYLHTALEFFAAEHWDNSDETMLLEVSKHFEEGAKKYGDNNWRKGIPVRCYIDSAVRHYLKYLRGDKDEPHDRAFCWNIMCAIWTCKHHPELNEYAKGENKDGQ